MNLSKCCEVLVQDVVYYFQPKQDVNVTISLCGNTSQPFDTVLVLLAYLGSSNVSAVACNDDFCGYQSLLKVSCYLEEACVSAR